MALVDYSSDGSSSSSAPPAAKKRKTSTAVAAGGSDSKNIGSPEFGSDLPPLPDAFHDLYAHTIRASNVDDPALHQGRRRLVPHVVGNWPSHLYVEWHPTQDQHEALSALLAQISNKLGEGVELFPLLQSDLGAPLPLHISLSRPLSLTTSNKDNFLESIRKAMQRCGVSPFRIHLYSLEWHRTEESGRSFLVLRVKSNAPEDSGKNQELMTILSKSNSIVKDYGLPPLYRNRDEEDTASAFHVSIGWTPSPISVSMTTVAAEAFAKAGPLRQIALRVDGIKTKIGNTVTNLPLSSAAETQKNSSSLLGLF
ncbi:snrna phosphodiesterase [Zalerion maritima]|uniref:U6 snRNA phosphodiesterase n=1 Tax=Zalerion maritima TaxID=339359 RepID=A0AAD5WMK2_9PEZI|nr:snrna phosphodiesterase [Zalerion maritima]